MQDWMIISSYARNALYSFRSYGSSQGWDTKLKCTPLHRILTGIKIMFGLSCSLLVERELSTTRWHHHCGNSHRAVQQINIHSPTYWVICLPLSGFCDREQPIKYRLRRLGKQRVMVLKLYPQLHVPRNFIEIIGGALESL